MSNRPKSVKSAMTTEEYAQLLRDVGMTMTGHALMLGREERTPQNWARTGRIPVDAVLPLVIMRERPELKELIKQKARELRDE